MLQETYLSLLRLGKTEIEINAVDGMVSWDTLYTSAGLDVLLTASAPTSMTLVQKLARDHYPQAPRRGSNIPLAKGSSAPLEYFRRARISLDS